MYNAICGYFLLLLSWSRSTEITKLFRPVELALPINLRLRFFNSKQASVGKWTQVSHESWDRWVCTISAARKPWPSNALESSAQPFSSTKFRHCLWDPQPRKPSTRVSAGSILGSAEHIRLCRMYSKQWLVCDVLSSPKSKSSSSPGSEVE